MTSSDKKKTVLLVILIGVGIGLYMWMYRTPAATSPAASAAKTPAKLAAVKPGQDAQIRTDLLEGIGTDNVGRKNLFQYRQKPVVKPPEPVRPIAAIQFEPPRPAPPVVPPPPPFKNFRYEGFSVVKDAKLLASVTESGTTYTVREGECLLGNYCISKLTETMVEIEDLQQKRKQTFMFTRTQ